MMCSISHIENHILCNVKKNDRAPKSPATAVVRSRDWPYERMEMTTGLRFEHTPRNHVPTTELLTVPRLVFFYYYSLNLLFFYY